VYPLNRRTTKVIARHVLFHIVLQWLSKCRAFDSNLEFFVQQKEMMNCFVCTPPPPYYPMVLVRHYLTLEGARNSVNWSVVNFNYKSKKNQATQYTQPPDDNYPIDFDVDNNDIPMPMPIVEAEAAGGSSPRTTTPTTPTTTISPNHTCLICKFC
jgi:hypothetical protein